MLNDAGGWWRDTAQRLIVERSDRLRAPVSRDLNETGRSVVAALNALAADAKDWKTRPRALWTLDGIDAIEPAIVVRALEDPSRDVRVSAIRLSERWLGEPGNAVRSAVLRRLDDDDWSVRQQLAASLGAMPSTDRDAALVTLLERHADDPVVLDAALSGVHGSEADVLGKLLAGDASSPQRDAAVTMFAATIVRSADDSAIQRLFEWTGTAARPQWQRAALLRGAEVAVLGAAMPGTPPPPAAPAAAALPCPTCPGGRAGPGGAYAYSKDEDFARAGLRSRNARAELRLAREPAPLSALAASGGELSARAANVLARLSWPGKPGAAVVTPLTAEEQRRFDAGRDIYRNICQACHQPDGRGQERVAPGLVGSPLLLAPAGVPARILLNGKDGKIGLMPPIGFVLDDEQIASVLTYVRREWGQAGAPVDPAAVKDVRAATTGRARPWTDDELMALVAAGEKK
jgi:mono/diheme cytochrome c family protein